MDKFNPFRFAGRIGRLQYFGFGVIWALVIIVVSAMGMNVEATGEEGAGGELGIIALLIVFYIATISYGVRRLHDFDKSGWWYLLMFIPFANFVMSLILTFAPGTATANRYGIR